jgi:hypothetical protein
MSLVIGVVLTAAAVVMFAWGYAQHRRAVPARWTRHAWLSSAFTILIVTMVPGAAGALTVAVTDPALVLATINILGVVAMVAAVAVAWWATPRFIREGRTTTAEVVSFPVSPGGAPVSPVKPRKMKRAA